MTHAPWLVLHVASNHEKNVSKHLEARSVEAYLPLYKQKSRWTDRTVTVERPLFPGYVFVRIAPEERVSVISIPGAIRLLGRSIAEMVDSAEVDRIRQSLAAGHSLRPHPALALGTRVRICSGIFEGVEGTVTDLRRNCRVVIALSAVHQCFSLEANIEEIAVLDKLPRATGYEGQFSLRASTGPFHQKPART